MDDLLSRAGSRHVNVKAAVAGEPAQVGHDPASAKAFHETVGPVLDKLKQREKMLLQQVICWRKGCDTFAADGCWKER